MNSITRINVRDVAWIFACLLALVIFGAMSFPYILRQEPITAIEHRRVTTISREYRVSVRSKFPLRYTLVTVEMPDGTELELDSIDYFIRAGDREGCLQTAVGEWFGTEYRRLVPMDACLADQGRPAGM